MVTSQTNKSWDGLRERTMWIEILLAAWHSSGALRDGDMGDCLTFPSTGGQSTLVPNGACWVPGTLLSLQERLSVLHFIGGETEALCLRAAHSLLVASVNMGQRGSGVLTFPRI